MRTKSWVGDRVGVQVTSDTGEAVDELVVPALRRNPRRAHLLVSGVLGKHVPAHPRVVHGSALRLGLLVRAAIGEVDVVVLGFAETATGLGHAVAEALVAPYLHSTRRQVATARPLAGFQEEHSHAADHLLLPEDPAMLASGSVLVLVDDELSTGRTARNTIAALHVLAPHRRYVIAALVDVRTAEDREAMDAFARTLGAPVDVVALGTGQVLLPDDVLARAAAEIERTVVPNSPVGPDGDVLDVPVAWPPELRESGRHGFPAADFAAVRQAAAAVAARLGDGLRGPRVLVLGTEELMYVPTIVALELEGDPGLDVRVSSTTRSPVLVVDEPGYPIRSVVAFDSHDRPADGPGPRFAYNVANAFDGAPPDDVVLVVDDDSDPQLLADGPVAVLRRLCRRVHVVTLPCHRPLPGPLRGPAFGSYEPDDVSWLLTDLSAVALEAPVEEREEAIQSGGAHYAESLPVEYQPDARYLELFEQALDDSATRIAHAVGVVTEIVLAERGHDIVLASLARAGTPVGVLMRRWASAMHGVDVPHYALSIVRGRGIDTVALRRLSAHHDPRSVVFVDGWTGKGAIARELTAAVDDANARFGTAFDPSLAVLADPGRCVMTFGTREDFLVPSACLNSTVSGLVSRTVLNRDVLAPGQFHGAKFYAELAASDVSGRFVDTVADRFASVADAVARDRPDVQAGDRRATWAGWAEVERIAVQHGIDDVTLVKPGVGETTRVLLRRVPWTVLVRAGETHGLAHVRLLAEQRGVPVQEVDGLTYRCVGLIHPNFTRGATGASGTAVRR